VTTNTHQGLPIDEASRKRFQATFQELAEEKETALAFLGITQH